MFTKDLLTAEVKDLRNQFSKAQQQLYAARQQIAEMEASVERLQGAIIVSEKYLALFGSESAQTGPQMPAPNSHLPEQVVS